MQKQQKLPVLYFQFARGERTGDLASLSGLESPKSVQAYGGQKYPIRCIWQSSHELPKMQTSGSAGIDLPSNESAAIVLEPGDRYIFSTGLHVEIPEGIVMDVRSRSGLAFKYGVCVLHGIGTVDSDYRGEVKVVLINHGVESYTVEPGERIAQLLFFPYLPVKLQPVPVLTNTKRGEGGFGSTGK